MSTKYDRTTPFLSRIKERTLLSKESAVKKTYHLSLCLKDSQITYRPGDSIAVIPSNDLRDVELLVEQIHDADALFRHTLLAKANLQKVRGFPGATLHQVVTSRRWSKEELGPHLLPLLPRFYSIASSPLLFPEEVHLTIAEVADGVATRFLCTNSTDETPISLYLQPTQKFLLPEDPQIPIILVGPGAGVAPFRAFLQQRLVQKASGSNWLFFGGRNRSSDFLYEEFWNSLPNLRLSCAFSRDTSEKFYVQHKLWEERDDLLSWIKQGAMIYVCGSSSMGKDVETTLKQFIDLKELRGQRRYLTDTY